MTKHHVPHDAQLLSVGLSGIWILVVGLLGTFAWWFSSLEVEKVAIVGLEMLNISWGECVGICFDLEEAKEWDFITCLRDLLDGFA